MTNPQIEHPKVVSRDEWLAARKALLAKEKDFTRQRDAVSAARRELPWVRVDKEYVFDAPSGKETLADLFDGRSQLIVYHFMLGPGWEQGCTGCSFVSDHIDGAVVHLAQRDVTLVVVSRAPLPEIEAFKKRMGWRFKWVSSYGSDFNHDYQVSFTKEEIVQGKVSYNYRESSSAGEELPGASVFYRDASGAVFHTYSTYARGLDLLIGAYNYLDLVPKGRDEDGLPQAMAWVRHHDRYASGEDPARPARVLRGRLPLRRILPRAVLFPPPRSSQTWQETNLSRLFGKSMIIFFCYTLDVANVGRSRSLAGSVFRQSGTLPQQARSQEPKR